MKTLAEQSAIDTLKALGYQVRKTEPLKGQITIYVNGHGHISAEETERFNNTRFEAFGIRFTPEVLAIVPWTQGQGL